ncbi:MULTISPECIES: GerAB/ArcD/ProY family transporter [Paenibacillus]|uniref:GerAB/ArcD/ProY family transporter n=1 Tax=Paenibacillus TaxID=44249 RepID=UPI001B25563B|nr:MULTISPECIES: GerAB/ArcD/ProY family transporter [Paenibacillus]MCM3000276.1 spore germination protein [Paenibacillus cellulositrophicus]GIO61853.1 spore germination protein YndE [Paenibacillus cineris]
MKLTKYQLFWLLFTMESGMTLLIAISPTFKEAQQGAPMAIFLAGVMSVLMTFIAAKLSLLYPNDTFIEYVPKIVGKWLGNLIVIAYLLLWIGVAGIILRQYADFVQMTLFMRTPVWAIVLFMLFVIMYAVHGGIHIIGRCSEIIGPIIVINLVLFRLLTIKDLRPERLLPLLPAGGMIPVMKGSLPGASFLGESVMIVMLIAFLTEKKRAISSGLWSVGIAAVVLLNVTLDVLMILDNTVPAKLQYPVYAVSQYISVMEFVQNLDILLVVGTCFSVFIKICLYLFMTSYGTARLFHLQKWRNILWITGLLVLVVALYPRNVDITQMDFPYFWKNVVLPIFLFGIPLLLWVIGIARKYLKRTEAKIP